MHSNDAECLFSHVCSFSPPHLFHLFTYSPIHLFTYIHTQEESAGGMLQEMVVEVDVSKYEDQIAELNKMLTSSNKTWEDREKQSLTFEQEQQEREAEALLKAERLQVRRVFAREERGGSERRMRSPAM